jgi:hypothetical protein
MLPLDTISNTSFPFEGMYAVENLEACSGIIRSINFLASETDCCCAMQNPERIVAMQTVIFFL